MTTKHTLFSGRLAVLLGVLRALGKGCAHAVLVVLRGLREFVLISGSYPSLTRDPGIAAYRLLEGHPRRSRPFRKSAISLSTGVASEPQWQFGAFL